MPSNILPTASLLIFGAWSLQQALERVAGEAEVDMVYDPGLVEGITVYQRVENQPVSDVLRNVLADTRLDFVTLSSGTIVIVEQVNQGSSWSFSRQSG
ncbi:MAG: STN domain-containing protein [Fodinibius sp.]|nr:STN domain-containing protein [Fodinibius sp.]